MLVRIRAINVSLNSNRLGCEPSNAEPRSIIGGRNDAYERVLHARNAENALTSDTVQPFLCDGGSLSLSLVLSCFARSGRCTTNVYDDMLPGYELRLRRLVQRPTFRGARCDRNHCPRFLVIRGYVETISSLAPVTSLFFARYSLRSRSASRRSKKSRWHARDPRREARSGRFTPRHPRFIVKTLTNNGTGSSV